MPSGNSASALSARISVSSAVLSHSDAGNVPSCCFQRLSDFDSTVAARGYHETARRPRVRGKVFFSAGGADMKRIVLLGTLLAAGAASIAAQTPAAPKII